MNSLRRNLLLSSVTAGLLLCLPQISFAKLPPVFLRDGVALSGHDAVAYFTDSKPVPGNPDYSVSWNGATWYFANEKNRDLFEQDPEAYAPQYGGYCAFAVSNGYTASTEPEAWRIVDGKLYLNYSLAVRERWQQDIPGNIERADGNWPEVLAK
ncbi:MAG: YHS domain-containing protein [Aestuariivita sp.]|nr:YHS domain-containing protein [Aestuariivita sp.]MCY4203710.1 YHS domain-containing protein [Aestuariivita sp.]MCY4289088.1 YHS domain-containing protein [Aestuariivita sp.]MCY4347688.1 YHS domain-containing protein [Aestuariivita sp.]